MKKTIRNAFFMETNETAPNPPQLTQEDMLREILENTRKTKNYIKWQLYITIALVVLPLLAMLVLVPMVLRSISTIGSVYGGGLLQ